MSDSTIAQQSITLDAALKITDACRRKAEEMGVPVFIAVLDRAGNVKVHVGMDGAGLLAAQVSVDKAYTAIGFGIPTGDWPKYFGEDKPLWDNIHAIKRAVPFAGGHPLMVNGETVGGIGVSGGHYSQDDEVLQAGIQAFSSVPGA